MQRDMLMNDMLSKLAADSKLVGIFYIVMGGLLILSGLLQDFGSLIFSALIGVPLIFIGVRAREGGEHIERFIGTDDPNDKISAYESYQKHFAILKVMLIVGAVILTLVILVFIIEFSKISHSLRY